MDRQIKSWRQLYHRDLTFSVKTKNNAKNFQVTVRISRQYNRIANKFVNKKGDSLFKS